MIKKYNIPGAVLSYKVGNRPIVTISAGYASLKPIKKMNNDSLFLVGSITKSFNSVLILRLVEQKKIYLDETLKSIANKYNGAIKKLVDKYSSLDTMTIRELLNHTSGVPQSINTLAFNNDFTMNRHKYYTPKMLMQIAMQHAIYFKPGTKGLWSYTNTDYVLTGLIIEDVSKHTFETNLKQLLNSIHLNNIYYANKGIPSNNISNRIALGYIPLVNEFPLIIDGNFIFDNYNCLVL